MDEALGATEEEADEELDELCAVERVEVGADELRVMERVEADDGDEWDATE